MFLSAILYTQYMASASVASENLLRGRSHDAYTLEDEDKSSPVTISLQTANALLCTAFVFAPTVSSATKKPWHGGFGCRRRNVFVAGTASIFSPSQVDSRVRVVVVLERSQGSGGRGGTGVDVRYEDARAHGMGLPPRRSGACAAVHY